MPSLADVYISIGSNIEPESNIARALLLLAASQHLTGVSTMYRSAALNHPDQPEFVNGVCRIATNVAPTHSSLTVFAHRTRTRPRTHGRQVCTQNHRPRHRPVRGPPNLR